MAKRGSEDLKRLSSTPAASVSQSVTINFCNWTWFILQTHHKTSLQKTSHDLQLSLVAFQRAQQLSAERQRTVVQSVRLAVEDDRSHFS